MNTIIRRADETAKAGLLDVIGAPISAMTGIFLLFYPYVILLVLLEDSTKLIGPQIVKASICLFFAFLFLVPRATQTFLRSRRSWVGAIIVRFVLILVFIWICFKFIESAKYYPGALNSLKFEEYNKIYIVLFSLWTQFYLIYFVFPGKYIRLLRHRHEALPGAINEKYTPPQSYSTSVTILKSLTNRETPLLAKVIGGLSVFIVVGLSFVAMYSDSYPSLYALELYEKYKLIISVFIFSTLMLLVLVRMDPAGKIKIIAPRGYLLLTVFAFIFLAWLTPNILFNRALPEHFHIFGESESFTFPLVLDKASFIEGDRFCTNRFNAIALEGPVASLKLKVCDVSNRDYERLKNGATGWMSGRLTIMGFKVDNVIIEN